MKAEEEAGGTAIVGRLGLIPEGAEDVSPSGTTERNPRTSDSSLRECSLFLDISSRTLAASIFLCASSNSCSSNEIGSPGSLDGA